MTKWLRNTELLVKLGFLAFLLLLLWTGRTYPEKSRLFPEYLCGITIILIIASITLDFIKVKGKKKNRKGIDLERPSSTAMEGQMRRIKEMEAKSETDAGYELLQKGVREKRLRESILIIIFALIISCIGGLLLTVPFFYIVFGFLHGGKKHIVKYIIIASGITLLVYLSFSYFMGVPLLQGLWWS